nr:hypothetical protein [Tanacetum cinerariifolium]
MVISCLQVGCNESYRSVYATRPFYGHESYATRPPGSMLNMQGPSSASGNQMYPTDDAFNCPQGAQMPPMPGLGPYQKMKKIEDIVKGIEQSYLDIIDQDEDDILDLPIQRSKRRLEEEALVEFMVELFKEDEDGKKNEKDGLFSWKANDQIRKA